MEAAWLTGIAAMVRAGARVIFDDVFLGGAASQERVHTHLEGLEVLWVGVRCAPEVAAGREIARGTGSAGWPPRRQRWCTRELTYDVEVDTGTTESIDCAHAIAAFVATGGRVSASPGAHGPG